MIPINFLFQTFYTGTYDLTMHTVSLSVANYEYSYLAGSLNLVIYIGSPADHDNSIYSSIQDWLDTNYENYVTSELGYLNGILGNIFEEGVMVSVDSRVQNANSNLTALSGLTFASGKMPYATGSTGLGQIDTTSYGRGILNTANQSALQTTVGMVAPDWNAITGFAAIANKPTLPTQTGDLTNNSGFITSASLPSVARTTSTLSLSLVGTGATGTQISSTKDSSVRLCVSTSATATISGGAVSTVVLKKCATNSATEGDWTSVGTSETSQSYSLAIALSGVTGMKEQVCTDVPAGWYVKLVNSGSGTHSEAFVSGEKTIYG